MGTVASAARNGRSLPPLARGRASGEGSTLQEAADDLVGRLLNLSLSLRNSGLSVSSEVPPDPHWLDYLWELGEISERGGDVRKRIFGPPDPLG